MGKESESIMNQISAAAREAWNKHPTTQIEDALKQAWRESEGRYRPPINWLEEAGLYTQAEILLTQLINSDLSCAPAKGINFLKQPYENDKVGVRLMLRYEGVDKQLADMGIKSISYQNQPQLFSPQKGEIRWLKIDWNNTQGETMQDVYEFRGLSVKKRVVRYKNGMPRTEVSDQRLNQEDFTLVSAILGDMSTVVQKLTARH